jgi:hypothetical protein
MESGPAVFAGTVFTLFGTGLLLWAGAQSRLRTPVAHGAGAGTAVLYAFSGVISLAAGVWCLLHT